MIRKAEKKDLEECVKVIRSSFQTVADELGFNEENAPRFTAFATTLERLRYHYEQERRPMFVYCDDSRIIGYYSLFQQSDIECELNHLCVLAPYRHQNIGEELFWHAVSEAGRLGCSVMNIGIVEENVRLRRWYEQHGAEHVGTEKYDFFPFTCGYMQKKIVHDGEGRDV